MITPAGHAWFATAVQQVNDLVAVLGITQDRANGLQMGIDTPTEREIRVLARVVDGAPKKMIEAGVKRTKPDGAWRSAMLQAIRKAHPGRGKLTAEQRLTKIEKRITGTLHAMKARSLAKGVLFDVTADQLRALILDSYGKLCPYLKIPLAKGFNVDHIIPISAGGPSTITNLQIISARANRMKEAMMPEDFDRLMALVWTMHPRSRTSVFRRLSAKPVTAYGREKVKAKMTRQVETQNKENRNERSV